MTITPIYLLPFYTYYANYIPVRSPRPHRPSMSIMSTMFFYVSLFITSTTASHYDLLQLSTFHYISMSPLLLCSPLPLCPSTSYYVHLCLFTYSISITPLRPSTSLYVLHVPRLVRSIMSLYAFHIHHVPSHPLLLPCPCTPITSLYVHYVSIHSFTLL